ncbi:peptidylprolyl isomerase [Cupriavidus basilensis]
MQTHTTRLLITSALAFGLQFGLPAAHAASVNGVAIPDSQVTATLQQAHLPDTPRARSAITQQLIARELFRQEAVKDKSLESRADVQQAIRDARTAILTQAWLKDRIKPAPVTDADVKARYDAIVATLGDKEYKARLIQVGDEASAKAALARIKGGEDFAKVAEAVSLAPSKANGGQMDWISFKVPAQEGKTQRPALADCAGARSVARGRGDGYSDCLE